MSTRDEHRAAIRENPECRTTQLVFADWLQEHGEDERAELVRVHVELARGVPLAWVGAGDRGPYHNGGGWCWFDAGRGQASGAVPESAELPTPVFTLLLPHPDGKGRVRWKDYPTAHAAKVAAGVAILEFGRES